MPKLCSRGVNVCPVDVCALFRDVTVPARNIISVFDPDFVIAKIGVLPEELDGLLEALGKAGVWHFDCKMIMQSAAE